MLALHEVMDTKFAQSVESLLLKVRTRESPIAKQTCLYSLEGDQFAFAEDYCVPIFASFTTSPQRLSSDAMNLAKSLGDPPAP